MFQSTYRPNTSSPSEALEEVRKLYIRLTSPEGLLISTEYEPGPDKEQFIKPSKPGQAYTMLPPLKTRVRVDRHAVLGMTHVIITEERGEPEAAP